MFNFLKNFIIAFLVVLAVYQTNKLWFENFSSHNFFYTVLHDSLGERQSAEIKSETLYAAAGSGSGRFFLSYEPEKINEMKQTAVKAAVEALSKGEKSDYSEEIFKNIIENRCIVITFGFLMTAEYFYSLYGGSGSEVNDFDSIVLGDDSSGVLKVVFFNSSTLEETAFDLKRYSDMDIIRTIIDESEPETGGIYYISSIASGYDVFKGSEFIPAWSGEMYFYTTAKTNPLEGDEATAADRFAGSYFENPVLKWTSIDEGVYTFSDESTVVKLYPAGVMEYSSYARSTAVKTASLGEKLLAAESFLDNEPNLKNEYFLREYKTEDDRTVFYFDLKINGYILELSAEMKEKTGLESFIEVTVDGSSVSKCKRYLRDYSTTIKEPVYTEKSFLEVIDRGLNELQGETIESLRLEYLENGDEGAPLCYYAIIDGREYTETAF
ncbi:MAG: hypothetical protein LUG66_06495 [Clostridiales bacterium]|nr:hypothetical protein [Clostridiales bacterium]